MGTLPRRARAAGLTYKIEDHILPEWSIERTPPAATDAEWEAFGRRLRRGLVASDAEREAHRQARAERRRKATADAMRRIAGGAASETYRDGR